MKLDGRRESFNVDDRRGFSSGKKTGFGGIGAIIIAGLIAWFTSGGDMGRVMQAVTETAQQPAQTEQVQSQREFTPEEQALAKFSKQILASTEDVWTKEFEKMGLNYLPPKMVLFTSAVNTGCGNATSAVGPFYCSADQSLYIDLTFFSQMRQQLGADGDFAYAYVIAHEVGHHVQHLLGTLNDAHAQMAKVDKATANKISVRIELQADFYAGLWGHQEQAMFNSLEPSDLQEALDCAHVIGDNYLQKKAQGYEVPESFTHGTSEQRYRWFKLGFDTGNIKLSDTFSKSDAEL